MRVLYKAKQAKVSRLGLDVEIFIICNVSL